MRRQAQLLTHSHRVFIAQGLRDFGEIERLRTTAREELRGRARELREASPRKAVAVPRPMTPLVLQIDNMVPSKQSLGYSRPQKASPHSPRQGRPQTPRSRSPEPKQPASTMPLVVGKAAALQQPSPSDGQRPWSPLGGVF